MIGNFRNNLDKITESLKLLIELFETLKSLWQFLLFILATIITTINFDKIKLFLIRHHIISNKVMTVITDNSLGIILGILTIVIYILCIIISRAAKQEIESRNDSLNTVTKLHNDFIHKIRDGIYELHMVNKKLIIIKESNNEEAMQEMRLHAFDNLIRNLQDFVNSISDFLSHYNDDTISVCIKIINSGQENVDNLDKKAKTLVRSKNTIRERNRPNENITIGKNSDFTHLCDGTNIWYHGIDLITKYNNHEYMNEAPKEDWQSKYNSTIVVPIRYYNTNYGELIHDIIGFLCIDSKNIVADWDDNNSFELQYLAIYADSIYTYIKLFHRIFDER